MAKSKYKSHVEPRLESIKAWKRKGLTDEQIMKNLKIGKQTFYNYKKRHVDFVDALKEALEDFVTTIENAHAKSATGFEYEERKVINDNGKKRVEITKKYMPGNVTAQIHILKNRSPIHWHDRKEIELQGNIKINVCITEDDE